MKKDLIITYKIWAHALQFKLLPLKNNFVPLWNLSTFWLIVIGFICILNSYYGFTLHVVLIGILKLHFFLILLYFLIKKKFKNSWKLDRECI